MKKNHFFTFCLSMLILLATFTNACAMEYDEYKVKKGDCFWNLAKSLKVDLKEFEEINRDRLRYAGNFGLIFPDQKLLIPRKHVSVEKLIKKESQASSVTTKNILAHPLPVTVKEKLPAVNSNPVEIIPNINKDMSGKLRNAYKSLTLLHENEKSLIASAFVFIILVCMSQLFMNKLANFLLWLSTLKSFSGRPLKTIKSKILEIVRLAFGADESLVLAHVGFVEKSETEMGGYFILDASGNSFIAGIDNLKKLAAIAMDLYKDDVKKKVTYTEPDQKILQGCRAVSCGNTRPLLEEEILEFEQNAFSNQE